MPVWTRNASRPPAISCHVEALLEQAHRAAVVARALACSYPPASYASAEAA
jgi:hypothetical protein